MRQELEISFTPHTHFMLHKKKYSKYPHDRSAESWLCDCLDLITGVSTLFTTMPKQHLGPPTEIWRSESYTILWVKKLCSVAGRWVPAYSFHFHSVTASVPKVEVACFLWNTSNHIQHTSENHNINLRYKNSYHLIVWAPLCKRNHTKTFVI
jgi:hypothetical protein